MTSAWKKRSHDPERVSRVTRKYQVHTRKSLNR